MAVRDIIQIGDSRLKQKNRKVTKGMQDEVRNLVEDLRDTMSEKGLIGIAAPQIGVNIRVFLTEPRETEVRPKDLSDELRVYINPVIVHLSRQQSIVYEGCGSVCNGRLFGPVKRPKELTIEASDIDGNMFRLRCDGLLARVILHEYDHLEGIEFTEKVHDYRKMMDIEHYIRIVKDTKQDHDNCIITVKEYYLLD